MKLDDVELGAVYRYTYSGPATGSLNRRGPWLVGTAIDKGGRGTVLMEPVPGLDISRSRPPAGQSLATIPAGVPPHRTPDRVVHVSRIDGRLCARTDWDYWLNQYRLQEVLAANERASRRRAERHATIVLVAALMALDLDVGRGPWDRSTSWGQFVDDLRRRELPILLCTRDAYEALASERRGITDREMAAAEAWLEAPIS